MREKSFEEFESLFERASIPVFNIPRISPSLLGIALTGSEIDDSLLAVAGSLASRFSARVTACWPEGMDHARLESKTRKYKFDPAPEPYTTGITLATQLNDIGARLLLAGGARETRQSVVEIDTLVEACDAPVLILQNAPLDPEQLFEKVLHSLSGSLNEIRHLAYSFSLVAARGSLTLLHTIDETEVDDVRDTLRVSPDVSTASGEQLIADLTMHAERYLKGMVAASHDENFDVTYRLGVGDLLDVVRHELAEGGYSMLVVGTHDGSTSRVDADDYQLMHMITDIPVLAL